MIDNTKHAAIAIAIPYGVAPLESKVMLFKEAFDNLLFTGVRFDDITGKVFLTTLPGLSDPGVEIVSLRKRFDQILLRAANGDGEVALVLEALQKTRGIDIDVVSLLVDDACDGFVVITDEEFWKI